jgi:DNA-binding NarL/FixJ family response regulator
MIKIFIADDHALVRDGIKLMINGNPKYEIVGEAANGAEALQKIGDLHPDLVLADISMPEMSGIELTTRIVQDYPDIRVMILSMHDNEDYINNSLAAGASGYLLKDTDKSEFLEAIEKISGGETYCGKNVSQILIKSIVDSRLKRQHEKPRPETLLSKREMQILGLIAKGLSNKEIATHLFISTRTVDAHRYNIMQKVNVRNTAELIMFAVNNKLIE